MTDVSQNDDLFDDATSEFASKFDLKDRLVLVWVTGVKGERKGENGTMYPWVETVTLVLDDGPDGYQATRPGDGGIMGPNLVASVAEAGPVRLDAFQWSATGLTSRLTPRISAKNSRPLLGRINMRANTKKGLAAPWSIADPTDADKATARKYNALMNSIIEEMKVRLANDGAPEDAFQ